MTTEVASNIEPTQNVPLLLTVKSSVDAALRLIAAKNQQIKTLFETAASLNQQLQLANEKIASLIEDDAEAAKVLQEKEELVNKYRELENIYQQYVSADKAEDEQITQALQQLISLEVPSDLPEAEQQTIDLSNLNSVQPIDDSVVPVNNSVIPVNNSVIPDDDPEIPTAIM